MSYGYPGQGYGPGGGYHQPPPPQWDGQQQQHHPQGGYGYSNPGQGQYNPQPPHDQGYRGYHQQPPQQDQQGSYNQGQYHPQGGYEGHHGQQQQQHHQQGPSQRPPGPPPDGYDTYGYPIGSGHQARDQGPQPSHEIHEIPSGTQQFGHGAPEGYSFQYSNCSGRRKALLIGINYFGQDGELRGCINDTKNVSAFLVENYGYKREDMVILTDDATNPLLQPTKENILRAMQWLVAGAQPNDALFLHYSGHGGQTEDTDGDEDDGFDEVIYPVDFKTAGHIVDDQIHDTVVKPLQAGVRLTAIFDSCHSGSVLDLPYIYSTKGVIKEPNLAKEAGQGLLAAVGSYARGDIGGMASSLFSVAKTAFGGGNEAYERTKRTKTSPADVIMWSGSKDDQTSADATIASQATGAMSWAFITAIKANPKQSYVQLLNSIRDVLETKYTQKPQLSSSHPIDVDMLFVM